MWGMMRARPSFELWQDLLSSVQTRATMMDSPIHGDSHWRGVALAGMRICDLFALCDRRVVLAFAMFHDSQRLDDDYDPEHGERAAAEVRKSRALKRVLAPNQIKKLSEACTFHEKGRTSEDPTIGACWDADRSNLWRVSVTPDRRFFSVLNDPEDFANIVDGMKNDWFNPPDWAVFIQRIQP